MYSNEETKNNVMSMLQRIFRHRKKRLLNDTEREFQRYIDLFTYIYLLFILVGVSMSFFSTISIHLCGVLLGILFCIMGGIYLFFFLRRKSFVLYRFFIIFSSIAFILGIFFFFMNPNHEKSYFICFGVSIILMNLERLYELFYLLRFNDPTKNIFMVCTILSMILSIFVFMNPFANLLKNEVLGIFSILFSILNLMQISLLQKRISEFVNSID